MNVRHATFADLSASGYDVQTFEHSVEGTYFEALASCDVPDVWKCPQPVIVPKAAKLRNAVLFNDGAVLLPDGSYCFSDYAFWYEDSWYNRSAKINIDIKHDGAILPDKRKLNIQGRCFPVLRRGYGNFGHFIHDLLTRIYYEDLGLIAPGREKVIAPNFPHPMQKILFEKIYEDYEIIYIPDKSAVEAELLILSSNLCSPGEFNPMGISALYKRMNHIMAPYARKEKYKVCVSRRDGARDVKFGRNFVNNEKFEIKMQNHGYRVMEISKISPDDQFLLWANTTDIIGIHGAGMMNMIMMLFEGTYTEIAGAGNERNWISRCAMAVGHRVRCVNSSRDQEDRPVIDLEELEKILS